MRVKDYFKANIENKVALTEKIPKPIKRMIFSISPSMTHTFIVSKTKGLGIKWEVRFCKSALCKYDRIVL